MLATLPIAADIAATLALSDRTETRVRNPGDTPNGPSLDLANTLEGRLLLASPRTSCTLVYAPRLTFWDINDVGAHPLWLQAGSARVESRNANTRLSLEEDGSYGAVNFSTLALVPGPGGAPPRVDVIPPPQLIQYESTTTTLGSRIEAKRWQFRTDVAYQLSGGADTASRQSLPLQKGPLGELGATFAASPVDSLETRLIGGETTFSSGPEIVFGEQDESWRHGWSAVTDTTMRVGVAESREQMTPQSAPTKNINPVAEAVVDHQILAGEDRFTLHAGARLSPVVNRLLGIVDERIQGTLMSKWTRRQVSASAFASAQQSIPTDGPNATELLTGELGFAYAASDVVVLDMGVRALWQKANQPITSTTAPGATEIVQGTILQGVAFVGVTLHAPTIRM
jgi:hypothetical protein